MGKTVNFEEMHVKAEKLATLWNEQKLARRLADAEKTEKALNDVVNDYNEHRREERFIECRSAENPLYAACVLFNYPTIKVKDVREKDTERVTKTIVDSAKRIDLEALHRFCNGKEVKYDTNWYNMAQHLNMLMTLRVADRIGDTETKKDILNNGTYAMNSVARAIDMGKTPLSNTNILKTYTKMIQAMIGPEYKVTSHHVSYLDSVYVSDDKNSKDKVKVPSHKAFVLYLQKVCNRLIEKKGFSTKYNKVKVA